LAPETTLLEPKKQGGNLTDELDCLVDFRDTALVDYQFQPIGFMKSCFVERFGTPRQGRLIPSSTGSITVRPDLNPVQILEGLQRCSHVWLIFVFHKNLNTKGRPKVHPPLLGGEPLGVFATRTPHRPNPIGLSVVKVDRITEDTIYLSGIDLIDGTPILDIKPYIRSHDLVPHAEDGYISERQWKMNQVDWTAEALAQLEGIRLPEGQTRAQIRVLVEEVLQMDPGSQMDKTEPARRDHYFITVFDVNVKFIVSESQVTVIMVENRERKDPRVYPGRILSIVTE
jgi:tRNA (adenine37-N6)-methyltransferase